jgi:hypothetical protein
MLKRMNAHWRPFLAWAFGLDLRTIVDRRRWQNWVYRAGERLMNAELQARCGLVLAGLWITRQVGLWTTVYTSSPVTDGSKGGRSL